MSTPKRILAETKAPKNSGNRVDTVKNFLAEHYEIKINVFDPKKSFIVCKNPDRYKSAIKIEDLSLHMEELGIRGCDSILKKIIASPNQITIFNPIVDYLKSLEGVWNGEIMIEKFCSYITVHDFGDHPEKDYYQNRFKKHFRKWGAAAIAQVLGNHPNDVGLFFVHEEEGIGKSSIVQFMVPPVLESYYQKSDKDPRYFDLTKAMTSNFIINFDDNVGMTKNNAEPIKSAMTNMFFKMNKFFEDKIPRMASVLGTSNKTPDMGGFLFPELGTRRWAVTQLEKIDHGYSETVDQHQLWAEFYVLYKTADFNYIWDEDFEDFKSFNMRFMVETNARKLIREYYRVPGPKDKEEEIVFKQPREIGQDLRDAHKITSTHTNVSEVTIGFALKSLGFEKTAIRKENEGPRYGYNVVQLY